MSPIQVDKSPHHSSSHTATPPSMSEVHDEKVAGPPDPLPGTILTGRKLAIVFVAMLLSLWLVALDQTILSTALPRIASDFQAFSLQGWMLRIFPAKWVLVTAISIFEVGSLLCGVSQNIVVGILQIISQGTRLQDRPRLFSLFGAVFGLSSVIGPLIGGAFTDRVTWRWCFFINLPVGGVSVVAVLFLLKASPPLASDPAKRSPRDILDQVLRLDFLGATLVAAGVTCLALALQWGGNTKPWGDKAVIIKVNQPPVEPVLRIRGCYGRGVRRFLGERAMTPTSISKSRSVWAILAYSFLTRFSLLLFSYYIPIFYQAVRHHSATKSGIDLLAFMLGVVVTVLLIFMFHRKALIGNMTRAT
ncbi:major facilitator superfamily domain-containing protein [Mycena polygramma]|nr:major facilitator superfamily domain-containing protein [Mycena polygramma]